MKRFRIATISLNTTPLDLEGNLTLHKRALESPEIANSSIALFPELSLSGYGCEDAFYRPTLWELSLQSLEELLPLTTDRIVVVGLPYYRSPYLYNVSAVLYKNRIQAIIPKKNLANTGIHYEKRWFTEWMGGIGESDSVPFGDILMDWNGLRIALEICEDSWVLHRPSKSYSELGVDLVLSPGASHFAMGKDEIRSRIFIESSRVQECAYAFSNLTGNEAGRVIFDGGNLITSNGRIYSRGKRLTPGDYHITTANLDLDEIRQSRVKSFRRSGDRVQDMGRRSDSVVSSPTLSSNGILHLDGSPFRSNLPPSCPLMTAYRENFYESFTSAQVLGLFDYLRKSKTKGYTLSLSGGADSSALAILVTTMEREIPKYYGKDYWKQNGYSTPLLHTIYQRTINNSDSTQNIAKSLAEELGAIHSDIGIDEEVESMTRKISESLGRELNWKDDDLALQNIQARVRSPLAWLLANTNGHLLLSTGNRSEASVGYTTMDGDSSGSLAPLTGISKRFLLDWLHFISQGEDKRIPTLDTLPILLESKPTAELKPLQENQEDEKDLMPYTILQKIEYWGIHEGKSPKEIVERLSQDHDGYSPNELDRMVKKFFMLFRTSQWKRERLPPSFHLDEYGLDPKSSYRYPILSGDLFK